MKQLGKHSAALTKRQPDYIQGKKKSTSLLKQNTFGSFSLLSLKLEKCSCCVGF